MSFPNIPNVTPTISINRGQVVNLLLASIAFEELGLAHVINAEAEKLQAALGTLPGTSLAATSVSQLLSVNQSVNRTLKTVLKTQMLLQFKLEDVLGIPDGGTPTPPPTPGAPANITLTASPTTLPRGGAAALTGIVTDKDGNPLAGIPVSLVVDRGTVAPASTVTNASGQFIATYTAPGTVGGATILAAVTGTTIFATANVNVL